MGWSPRNGIPKETDSTKKESKDTPSGRVENV